MKNPNKSFFAAAKQYLAPISAAVSFVSVAIGAVQSFSTQPGFAALTLLIAGTAFLLLYNVWIAKATHPGASPHSAKLPRFRKTFRVGVHCASVLVLSLAWTAAAIARSDKYLGHILLSLHRYDTAGRHLRAYVQSSPHDYQVTYDLACCLQALGKTKESVETREALAEDGAAFLKLSADDRQKRKALLHTDIAFDLLTSDYIEGVPDRLQRAEIHIEKARLLTDTPVLAFMLGYIKAAESDRRRDQADSIEPSIREIFATAKASIEDAHLGPTLASESMIQYHYWLGKSLVTIEKRVEAQEELEAGLALLNKSMPENLTLKEMFLYLLGLNELFKSDIPDLQAAQHYWSRIAGSHYLAERLTLAGAAFWAKGWDQDRAGDKAAARTSFDSARVMLSEAAKLGERSFHLSLILGILYFNQSDYTNAAVNFAEAARFNPQDPVGHYWLGRAKFQIEGGLSDACKAMARAVELEPTNEEAHYWLGRMLGESHDFPGAIAELEKSVALHADYPDAHFYLIAMAAELAEEKEPESADMTAAYERALRYAVRANDSLAAAGDSAAMSKITALQGTIWNGLAYNYAQRGENLTLALNYIEQAVKSVPSQPYYLDTKAWVIVRAAEISKTIDSSEKQRRYEEAEGLLRAAMDSYKADDKEAKAESLYHLGYIAKLQGADDKAKELFLKALEIDPEYRRAKDALK